jgi:hypothetical protein
MKETKRVHPRVKRIISGWHQYHEIKHRFLHFHSRIWDETMNYALPADWFIKHYGLIRLRAFPMVGEKQRRFSEPKWRDDLRVVRASRVKNIIS